MFPLQVDPRWYEKYWLTDRPPRKRASLARGLTRVAVVVALFALGGAVLNHFAASHGDWSGYQDWEQE